jgi:hypothetical protein
MKAPFRIRTAEELRKQPQENRDAAEAAADPKTKAILLRLAVRYEALADELDRANRRAPQAEPKASWGNPFR